MKMVCPKCYIEIEVKNIHIQLLSGKCISCNEFVNINTTHNVAEKPKNSPIQESRLSDGTIELFFPLMDKGWGLIPVIFGGFVFIAFWSVVILNYIYNQTKIDRDGILAIFIFMFISFVFLFIGIGLWKIKTTMLITKKNITVNRKIFGFNFVKKLANNSDIIIERVERYRSNDVPVYGAKISNSKDKAIEVGGNLSDDEIFWIKYLINHVK